MLDPEGRVGQGVVLRGGSRIQPDAAEPLEVLQVGIARDVEIVVPDVAVRQHRQVGKYDCGEQGGSGEPPSARGGLARRHRSAVQRYRASKGLTPGSFAMPRYRSAARRSST